MGSIRARDSREKEARRRALIDAARQFFNVEGEAETTMADIAGASGISKATAYLYFRNKELVFLAVLEEELQAWSGALFDALQGATGARSGARPDALAASIADAISGSLTGRPLLLRLLGLLHDRLEPALTVEEVRAFKLRLSDLLQEAGAVLEDRLPGLPAGEGARLLLRCYALLVGVGQLCTPSVPARHALDAPELRWMNPSFDEEFRASLRALLAGSLR